MAIVYTVATNTITVTGYTVGTPCTFTNIYNADVAGAWGVVSRQCTNQFCFDCKLVIGDGSTASHFSDKEKQITLTNIITAGWDMWIDVKNNAYFTLGVLNDLSTKSTKSGCCFLAENQASSIWLWIKGDTSSYINIYSSQFISLAADPYAGWVHTRNVNNRIWNCMFCGEGAFNGMSGGGTGNFYNLTIQDGFAGLAKAEGVFENITVTGCSNGIHWWAAAGGDLKNCLIENCTKSFDLSNYTANHSAINTVSDWTFNWIGTCTGKVYRKNEFELKVIQENSARTPISGATVKIWDLNDNLVTDTTTDANGEIATQTLIFGYYNQAGGNTPVMETPHKIEIRKSGSDFLTVTKYMYMDYTRKEVISMVDMSNITDKLDVIQADLDNPDQYKADVSGVASESTVDKIWNKIRKGKGVLKLS